MNPKIVAELLEAERVAEADYGYWWLSFADADLPEGSQFLGVAIVRAATMAHAIQTSHRLGCNPGGSVGAVVIHARCPPPGNWLGRCIADKAEIARLDFEWAQLSNAVPK